MIVWSIISCSWRRPAVLTMTPSLEIQIKRVLLSAWTMVKGFIPQIKIQFRSPFYPPLDCPIGTRLCIKPNQTIYLEFVRLKEQDTNLGWSDVLAIPESRGTRRLFISRKNPWHQDTILSDSSFANINCTSTPKQAGMVQCRRLSIDNKQ